jgi:hypothetical protein
MFVGCADAQDLSETLPTDSASSATPADVSEAASTPHPDPPTLSKVVVADRLDAATKQYGDAFLAYLHVYNTNPERLDAVRLRLVDIDHTFKRWVDVARTAIALRIVRIEATTFSKYVSAFQRWLQNQVVENQLFLDCFSTAYVTEEPPPGLADCIRWNPALFRLGNKYAAALNEFQRRHPELADLLPDAAL